MSNIVCVMSKKLLLNVIKRGRDVLYSEKDAILYPSVRLIDANPPGSLWPRNSNNNSNNNKGFLGRAVVKNPPTNAEDTGSIPGSGRSPGGGNGYPLQFSCLLKAH